MAGHKGLPLVAFCATLIGVAAVVFYVSAPDSENEATSRKERSVSDEEGQVISELSSESHVKVIPEQDVLEYEFVVTMVNYGNDAVKVSQTTHVPNGVEIKSYTLEMSHSNVTRQRRRAGQEELTQWAGGVANIQPGYQDTSTMIYVNHPAEIFTPNTKTFHRLAATVTILDDNLVGGEISTPGYPENYPNGADITWVIAYPPGNVVRFEMLSYSMEECCDHLFIYDGANKSSAVLASFDGDGGSSAVVSTKSAIFIRFTSDCLVSSSGFKAKYINQRVVSQTTTPKVSEYTTAYPMSCGSIQANSGNSGNAASPNYPGNYAKNMNCSWNVQTYYGTKLDFTVQSFNLQYGDYLYIYEGSTYSPGQRLAQLSGYQYPGYSIKSYSNRAFLVFSSDSSSSYGYGYNIYYEGVNDATTEAPSIGEDTTSISPIYYSPGECNDTTYIYNSDITSPGYYSPGFYPPNQACIWMVQTYSGYFVQLYVHYFYTEYGRDWVSIFNGYGDSSSDLIAQLSGYISPGTVVATSNSRYATLTFYSDNIDNYRGFDIHCSYSYVYPDAIATTASSLDDATSSAPEVCSSPSYQAGYSGYVQSPNYPSYYSNNLNCTYWVQAPYGYDVGLTVQSFSLSSGDYLRVYDGYSGNYIANLYGYLSYGYYVQANSNYVSMVFTTNDYNTASGFNIRYSAEYDYNYYDYTTAATPSNGSCNEQMHGNYGTITSPNYPSAYQNNLNCVWTVQVSSYYYVLFTVNYFNTESYYDYVNICRGTPSYSYGCPTQLTGYVSPGTEFLISDNDAYVTFYTDVSVTTTGFTISYSAVSTNYVTNTTSGYDSYTTPQMDDSTWWRMGANNEEAAKKSNIIGRDLWEGAKNRPKRREMTSRQGET